MPLEEEFDTYDMLDGSCDHILVYYHGGAVGTGRLNIEKDSAKLERICILKPYRKFGLGKVIIQKLEEIAKRKEINHVKLHGQTKAEGFYKKLGYQTSSNVFIEDGIPHILMTKKLSTQ